MFCLLKFSSHYKHRQAKFTSRHQQNTVIKVNKQRMQETLTLMYINVTMLH